jgi:hypothetical protein
MKNLRKIVRWWRFVLPSPLLFLPIMILIGSLEIANILFLKPLNIPDLDSIIMTIRLEFSGFLCVIFGFLRVINFHPWFQRSYRQWLAATPWSPGKPLPLGPIHLIVQDFVILGLVYWYVSASPYALPVVVMAFLGPYLIILGYSFFCAGVWPFGYALTFGLGMVGLLAERLEAATFAMLGCYTIAFFGIRAMLSKFPWKEVWESSMVTLQFYSGNKRPTDYSLGWHFERLAPLAKIFDIPLRHCLLFPLLAGWICFTVAIHAHDYESQKTCFLIFYIIPCIISLVARLGFICFYYRNPLGLFGRIFPGPLIIPRYDKVFLVPLGLVFFAVAVPLLLMQLGLNFALLLAVSLTLVLFLAINGKPSLRNWVLTGGYRIAPWPRKIARLRG